MVAKRSEYQNQFKSSVIKRHHDIYRENLALRHERRDREFMHTPVCWGEQVPEEVVGSDSSEEEPRPLSKAKLLAQQRQDGEVYQSLAEIMAEAKEKAEAVRRQRLLERAMPACVSIPSVEKISLEDGEDVNKSSVEKKVADKSFSIGDIVDKENRKLTQKIAQAYVMDKGKDLFLEFESDEEQQRDTKIEEKKLSDLKDKESNLRKKTKTKRSSKKSLKLTSNKCRSQSKEETSKEQDSSKQLESSEEVPSLSQASRPSKRPERPDRQSRLSSKGKRRPASACSPQPFSKPPFLAYGAADVEDSLALHRTHNVLAPAGVYQPALRAKTRREEEQRRHREKIQTARLRAGAGADGLLDRLSTAALTPRNEWASEYSLQFHGYEPKEYERAVSARSVIPRPASAGISYPGPATVVLRKPEVRSGGCRVIHVD